MADRSQRILVWATNEDREGWEQAVRGAAQLYPGRSVARSNPHYWRAAEAAPAHAVFVADRYPTLIAHYQARGIPVHIVPAPAVCLTAVSTGASQPDAVVVPSGLRPVPRRRKVA